MALDPEMDITTFAFLYSFLNILFLLRLSLLHEKLISFNFSKTEVVITKMRLLSSGIPLCSLKHDDWLRGTGEPGSLHSTPLSQCSRPRLLPPRHVP